MRKAEIEAQVVQTLESFLDDTEMLASLAVDMAHHHREMHGRGDEVQRGLESRRRDVESKLGNFVKAIAAGIFNDTTAAAMAALEEQKRQLDEAIQAEHGGHRCRGRGVDRCVLLAVRTRDHRHGRDQGSAVRVLRRQDLRG